MGLSIPDAVAVNKSDSLDSRLLKNTVDRNKVKWS